MLDYQGTHGSEMNATIYIPGNLLHELNFPYGESNEGFDGPLSAGAIGNIDDDADLEIGKYE